MQQNYGFFAYWTSAFDSCYKAQRDKKFRSFPKTIYKNKTNSSFLIEKPKYGKFLRP